VAAELTKVVQALAPTLRGSGYRRFGQTFNRECETGLIQVIGFQGGRSGDRFTLNVGIYVREIDQLWHDYWTREGPGLGTTKVLREESCWLRGRMGDLLAVADDCWWPYADSSGAIRDVGVRLQTQVEPVLGSLATRASLIVWWDSPPPRRPRWRLYATTCFGFALLLRDAGRHDDAMAIVQREWQQARGPFRGTVELYAEQLGLAIRDT